MPIPFFSFLECVFALPRFGKDFDETGAGQADCLLQMRAVGTKERIGLLFFFHQRRHCCDILRPFRIDIAHPRDQI
ncbi:MAG: hypothetical protein VX085_09535, partial [Pseudomonadota bacterium]|nr:hypothetical protein [Pseudomonadota bacterium]